MGGGRKLPSTSDRTTPSFFPSSIRAERFLFRGIHADRTQAEVWPELHIHEEQQLHTLNHYSKRKGVPS